ncbi:MAG: aldose 1-epimerase family protein [Planctomycetota bacterium]|nr:aldose 1-epimerase family protein [Planctomycetota bacterium]MDA1250017.1 aldose 1-epimerase family protein [Planctomycetota bacterium]
MKQLPIFLATFLSLTATLNLTAQEQRQSSRRGFPVRITETDDGHVIPIVSGRFGGWPFKLTHETHPDVIPEGCSVERMTLHGGKSEGVELVRINNGTLAITVIPTRGMSVLEIVHADVRLGWDSPVKDPVHPSFVNLESRGGLGWLEGFNEWMVRCGLEYAGHPGVDKFINNTGDEAEMTLTVHGKIGNIPASTASVVIDKKAPHRIRVRGTVHERMFYGPKLQLDAEISTEPGATTFRIDDAITNHGAFDQEFQIIYHGNYGSSILEKGATIHTATKSVAPMNDHAAKAVSTWQTYAGPTKGFIEEVFLFEPIADDSGHATAVLSKKTGDLATSVRWSTKELPYLTVWKNTADKRDGYVTGIEPATGYPFNRSVERKAGRVPKLAPGATRKFGLEFGILSGKAAVATAISKVDALMKSKPVLREAPPKVE